jgi:hypothetical protein
MTDDLSIVNGMEPERQHAVILRLLTGTPDESEGHDEDDEIPPAPVGSSAEAQMLWFRVLNEFDLSLGEMAVLEQVVALKTAVDNLTKEHEALGSPVLAEGYMGKGTVTHPLLVEIRQTRKDYLAAVRQLGLPAEEYEGGRKRPGQPRKDPAERRGRRTYPGEPTKKEARRG